MGYTSDAHIFDTPLKLQQRSRARKLLNDNNRVILDTIATHLVERLEEDIATKPESALLLEDFNILANSPYFQSMETDYHPTHEPLPTLESNQYDLIVSFMQLHWINDVPGALIQIRQALKDRGVFMGVFLGGDSLNELRSSVVKAESDIYGGISPRLSPLIEVKDAGQLLQRTGYHLPVSDTQPITVMYKDLHQLLSDLRAMGEMNGLIKRNKQLVSKRFLERIAEHYVKDFADEDNLIPATFDVITITGWKS